jgi:hypothetical protein
MNWAETQPCPDSSITTTGFQSTAIGTSPTSHSHAFDWMAKTQMISARMLTT